MTEQLDLLGGGRELDPAKRLGPRQRTVLEQLQAHGHLDADEAGAIMHELKTGRWAHSRDTRCDYCAGDGRAVLDALVKKGYATRTRPGTGSYRYHAAGQCADAATADPHRPVSEGGSGALPEGF